MVRGCATPGVFLQLLYLVGASQKAPETGGDDILSTLREFDKAYDNTVVGAMGTASHAAGKNKLGSLESEMSAVKVGASSGSIKDQMHSFKNTYDASVSPAFSKSTKAVNMFQRKRWSTRNDGDTEDMVELGESMSSGLGKCDCHLCGEMNEPQCCATNECDNTGQAHLTNYEDTNAGQCDCNTCDATAPNKWTAEMNTCCPKKCEAWTQKAAATPPPAPTPPPVLRLPSAPVDPARPYVHEGKTLTAPYPKGVPYQRTKEEKRALAKLRVYQEIERITAARAAVAKTAAEAAAAKLRNAKKPDAYDKNNAKLPRTPPFAYTHKSYGDHHLLDTGPVNDIGHLEPPGKKPEPIPEVVDQAVTNPEGKESAKKGGTADAPVVVDKP